MEGRPPYYFLALAAVLALLIGACDTNPQPSGSAIAAEPSGRAVETALAEPTDCRSRIDHATFDDLETIERVAGCRFTRGGVEAATEVLRAGGTRDSIWSALWIYDVTGADLVRPYLEDKDTSVRVIAAAILARLGERRALTELAELAGDNGVLLGSHPPVAVGEFAIRSLARSIAASDVPSSDVDHETLGPAAKAWQGWLTSVGPQLTYDADAGEWNR